MTNQGYSNKITNVVRREFCCLRLYLETETMTRFASIRYAKIILLLVALIGLFGVWFVYRSPVGAGNIRNVLLISIDTCRADYLSCYGYKSQTTPHIDAMAAEGSLI